MRSRSELLAHIQNTTAQYNLPAFGKKIAYRANRTGVAEAFADPHVQKTIAVDLQSLHFYDRLLTDLELRITKTAKEHDPQSFYLLRSIPGVGKILALVFLYEIHDIARFPRVQDFASYARLVRCPKESAGKRVGSGNKKIGNVHLKWAFSEAACLFLRNNEPAQRYPRPAGQQARQSQSAGHYRPQAGPRGVFHAPSTGGLRSEESSVCSVSAWGRPGEPGA
jgi:transposase